MGDAFPDGDPVCHAPATKRSCLMVKWSPRCCKFLPVKELPQVNRFAFSDMHVLADSASESNDHEWTELLIPGKPGAAKSQQTYYHRYDGLVYKQ